MGSWRGGMVRLSTEMGVARVSWEQSHWVFVKGFSL